MTARRGNWQKFTARKRNKKFQAVKKKVFERDQYTCQYCGFFAKEFQEVINRDHDYTHNKMSNMITTCSFCAQCFFLDTVGVEANTGGWVIHLPEMSQADLNNFCRVLFCSLDKDTAYKGKLQSVYMSLRDRAKEVENCFGPNASDPRTFGQGLVDTRLTAEQLEHEVLQHLRLLPNKANFKSQVDYWKKTVFAEVPL